MGKPLGTVLASAMLIQLYYLRFIFFTARMGQYSSARMIVITREVTFRSDGSEEW